MLLALVFQRGWREYVGVIITIIIITSGIVSVIVFRVIIITGGRKKVSPSRLLPPIITFVWENLLGQLKGRKCVSDLLFIYTDLGLCNTCEKY